MSSSMMMVMVIGSVGIGVMCMSSVSGYLLLGTNMGCQLFPEFLCGSATGATGGTGGDTGTSGPPVDCSAQAKESCTGIRGKERDTCISKAKKACVASGGSSSTTGSPDDTGGGPISSLYGGSGGSSQYNVQCPSGTYMKGWTVDARLVGPHVTGQRHRRVQKFEIQCSDGKWRDAAPGDGKGDYVQVGCSGHMTGAAAWVSPDNKVIQRMWPTCDANSTVTQNSTKSYLYGDPIGTRNQFDCPAGQKLVGVSGWYGTDLDSVKFYCK